MSEFKIEDTFTLEEAKKEFRYYCDLHYGLILALRDLPDFPKPWILMHLATSAKYPEDFNKGKELQQKYGSQVIPYKHECEGGAGLWFRIRQGLINAT